MYETAKDVNWSIIWIDGQSCGMGKNEPIFILYLKHTGNRIVDNSLVF